MSYHHISKETKNKVGLLQREVDKRGNSVSSSVFRVTGLVWQEKSIPLASTDSPNPELLPHVQGLRARIIYDK